MKRYFPIFLGLTNKEVVIIGGGKVAERKALSLLRYNARIKMVSPALTVRLQEVKKGVESDIFRGLIKKGI